MQKAIDRFWTWIMPAAFTRINPKSKKAHWYRYPSPGSIDRRETLEDYKQAFNTSIYNIRYKHLTPKNLEQLRSEFYRDPLAQSTIE